MSININQKQKIINKLTSLKENLVHIKSDFQIDISELINKVNQAIINIKDDLFSIAFFGAFSDGKSTILSLLIDKYDIAISPEPTTDKIQAYEFNDYLIIDTPGLFSDNLMHDELTKKYISEANIVIFTLDPVNPLKESHLPTIKWILSDLNKIESTIFVINKMDEIADLEDDNDFEKNAEIKKEVVSEIIKDEVGITEINKMVCIAADPFGLGLSHWKNNEDYKKISRIDTLEKMISKFKSSYENELVVKAGISVIRDASTCIISELDDIKTSLNSELDCLKNQIDEFENRIKTLNGDINRSYVNIKDEFIILRKELFLKIDSSSNINELSEVIQAQLGKDAYIIQEKIDLIIRKHTNNLLSESQKIFESLEESLNYHSNIQNELLEKLSDTGKSVLKGMLSAPTRKIADTVIKVRNFLNVPFKFKPWGALKFAKYLKAMPAVIELLEIAVSIYSKLKMNQKKAEVRENIENGFKELIKEFNIDKYTKNYFPFLQETENLIKNLKESKNEIKETVANIDKIKQQLNIEKL